MNNPRCKRVEEGVKKLDETFPVEVVVKESLVQRRIWIWGKRRDYKDGITLVAQHECTDTRVANPWSQKYTGPGTATQKLNATNRSKVDPDTQRVRK